MTPVTFEPDLADPGLHVPDLRHRTRRRDGASACCSESGVAFPVAQDRNGYPAPCIPDPHPLVVAPGHYTVAVGAEVRREGGLVYDNSSEHVRRFGMHVES